MASWILIYGHPRLPSGFEHDELLSTYKVSACKNDNIRSIIFEISDDIWNSTDNYPAMCMEPVFNFLL